MSKSEDGQTEEKQTRETNDDSQSEQTNIAGKPTKDPQKVETENRMKKDKNFKRKEMNSEGGDSKMEVEEDMMSEDFLEGDIHLDIHLAKDKKNLAVKIENIN